jgi:hypothetical protein
MWKNIIIRNLHWQKATSFMHKKNEEHKKCISRFSKLYLSFMSVVIRLKAGQAGFPFPGGEIIFYL